MGGGTLAFEGIAFEAGGNQVAVGVAPGADAGPWFVKRECKYFLSTSNTRDYGASRRDSELPRLERVKKLRFRMKSPVGWFFPVGSFAAALAFWFACIVRFGAAPSQAIVAAGCGARCNRNQRVKL